MNSSIWIIAIIMIIAIFSIAKLKRVVLKIFVLAIAVVFLLLANQYFGLNLLG